MKEIITEAQKRIIEDLMNEAPENADAIIAMGRDMFHQGQVKGMIMGGVFVTVGLAIGAGASAAVLYFDSKKKLEELEQQLDEI